MNLKIKLTLAALLSGCLLGGGCSGGGGKTTLTGGGSSFVNPIMTKWAGTYYADKGLKVDYTSSGSSNGVQQMIDKKNDFGCTDAFMTEEELAKASKAGGAVVHIPLVMGAVVPVYNLKDVKAPLRFTGPVLAAIFLGKITKWNDMRLKELNPGVDLPGQDIAVVHRSDGSGTTNIWSDYLAKVDQEWKEKVGVGNDLKWPVGMGAPKNDGVAGQVSRTPGAIGYIELIYALKNDIQFGDVQNKAGEFVRGSLDSVTKAAEGALTNVPEDLRYTLTDAPGSGAYPISGTTWAVLYVNHPPDKAKALAEFFRWVVHQGQDQANELHYARLPEALIQRVDKKLDTITSGK